MSVIYNPWHGCKKYSAGCQNCYVYRRDESIDKDPSIIEKNSTFDLPIQKKRDGSYKIPDGEKVYTCMTSDFFLKEADAWRNDVWKMIKERSAVNFVIITKRILRFSECLPSDWGDGYENVTVCSTVEDQSACDERLPCFITLPIVRREIICEPLLSPITLEEYLSHGKISHITVGGESGENGRVCDFEWVKDIKRQCDKHNVSFFFKQTGTHFAFKGKIYTIERKLQFSQAERSGLNQK